MQQTFEKYGITFFANKKEIDQHDEEVKKIIDGINNGLKNEIGYAGFDFCDVGARDGIQIRLFHENIKGYSVGEQATLLYDWSNADDVIKESIENFKEFNTPAEIIKLKDFIAFGEKYGWD